MKYLLVILLLCGCYTPKKAKEQFNKAALNYPEIPAAFCAAEFPVKDSTISDTLFKTDTIIFFEQDIFTDTIIDKDTVRITKTLPGKIITNTVRIRDTVYQTNTAALRACEIEKSKTIDLLVKKTDEADKYKGQAKKRGLFLWGLIAFLILVIGANIWLKAKKISFKK